MKPFPSFSPPPLPPALDELERNEKCPITPRNESRSQDKVLLTPPPAPMGTCYDERDLVVPHPCIPTSKQRQDSTLSNAKTVNNESSQTHLRDYSQTHTGVTISGGDTTAAMLDFPMTLRNFDLNHRNEQHNQDSQDRFFRSITPSKQLIGRRRRANSVDDLPYPKITLRPRFSRHNNLSLPTYLRRRDNFYFDSNEEDSQVNREANTETFTHRRSSTYDGHSSILDNLFCHEPTILKPPPLPTIRSGLDVSQLGRELPQSSTSRAGGATSPPRTALYVHPLDNANIPRPVPRYSTNRMPMQKISSTSPPHDRRYNFSASEATTTCTLSLSSHSAFGTPTPLKVKTNPSSPLTPSGSDSGASPNGLYTSSLPVGSESGNSIYHHHNQTHQAHPVNKSVGVGSSSFQAFSPPCQGDRDDIFTMVCNIKFYFIWFILNCFIFFQILNSVPFHFFVGSTAIKRSSIDQG